MHRSTRSLVLTALLVAIAPARLVSQQQEARPLRKSDLVRFLSGTTYSRSEIAAIVRRSCLGFQPTSRDRETFRTLGADEAIMREIDACAARRNRPVTGSRPRAPLQLALNRPQVSAAAGSIASIPVTVRRGSSPWRGVRLVLNGIGEIVGGSHDSLTATTDAQGRANFVVPAGTAAATYRLTVTSAGPEALRGDNVIELRTTAAEPARVEVTPNPLSVLADQQGNSVVVVAVRDEFDNPVEGARIELRPSTPRETLPQLSRVASERGHAEFQIPTVPLRDGDRFDIYVNEKALASLSVQVAPAPAKPEVIATGRSASAERIGVMLQEVERLAKGGQHADAEAALDSVLRLDPDNFDARIRRGYLRSWQKKYVQAQDDFADVLRRWSNNADALVGLGYTLAWSGNYAAAEERFRQALEVEPLRLDAQKGLAYVALWSGDAKTAVRRFDSLTTHVPTDAEAAAGLGQAHFAAGQLADARAAFRRTLLLEPGRKDAERGLEAARHGRARVELTAWTGYTGFSETGQGLLPRARADSPNGEVGLRLAEAAVWPTDNLRLWVQYDNGLSLDHRAFVDASDQAPAYYVGGMIHWAGRFFTRLEGGFRNLPGGVRQQLFRGEQVFVLGNGVTLKGGGFVAPRSVPQGDDLVEGLGYASVGWTAGRLRLEPTVFVSKSSADAATQARGLLSADYRFDSGLSLGSGFAFGQTDSQVVGESERLWEAFLRASVPFTDLHRVNLLLRHQVVGGIDRTTIVALGFTFGLLRE